jgi:hypothetical protein
MLHVQVTNATDLGYTAVRLVIHIPGDIICYSDELLEIGEGRRANFPARPMPLGTPMIKNHGLLSQLASYQLYAPNFALPGYSRNPGSGPMALP